MAASDDVVSRNLQDVTTKILKFLSHANNETIGACLVALAAVTYFVLGRLGLLLIGFLVGVVLQATWQGDRDEASLDAEARRRKEVGLDVARRLLDWEDSRSLGAGWGDPAEKPAAEKPEGGELGFADFQPATRAALNELVDAALRDYVR
jgi:hypothetical protein